jgi:hypothetical protein
MTDSFQTCVDAAGKEGLECILIGGHAVNARGYLRTTLDVDFVVRRVDLQRWKDLMCGNGFCLVHETKAFAQFSPPGQGAMRVDLMLVDDATFTKLAKGSDIMTYGNCRVRVAGVLHLVALKLHATRTWNRAVQGKDFYDIVELIRIHRIDPTSSEFQYILNRYATPSIKERLLSDLRRIV